MSKRRKAKKGQKPLPVRVLAGKFRLLFLPYRTILYAAVLCMILAGLSEALLPWLLGELLDSNLPKPESPLPREWLPFAFLAAIILRGVLGFGRIYLAGWLEVTIQKDLREQAAARVLFWPPKKLMTATAGDITSHIVFFTGGLAQTAMRIMTALVQETARLFGYLFLLFSVSVNLTLLMFASVVPIMLVTRYFNRRIRKKSAAILRQQMQGVSEVNELVDIWQLIKLHAGQDLEKWRLRKLFLRFRSAALKRIIAKSSLPQISLLLLALPFVFILAQIIAALQDNTMTPGEASVFLTTMLLLQIPVRNIISAISSWTEMAVTASSVFKFLELPLEHDAGNIKINTATGALSFQNLSFSYTDDGKKALDGVNLEVAAGETLALVGRSGSGKTTLAHLLPRFHTPTDGRVCLDGADIADISLPALRRQIALVTQHSLLLNDTVAVNVAYPDDGAQDSERIWQALKNAAADEFVAALPDGIHTVIGEGGKTLSGGQRQRLTLARAFYRDAPIVILDEATSALDSQTEAQIKPAMQRLLTGRTAIIIAHRFATVDFADRVAVLDDGNLVAVGRSEELRKTCPLYAALYDTQIPKLIE